MEDIIQVNIKEFTSTEHVARKTKEAIEAFEKKETIRFTNCKCGEISDYGCHGIRNGEVYSEFYCKECYLKNG